MKGRGGGRGGIIGGGDGGGGGGGGVCGGGGDGDGGGIGGGGDKDRSKRGREPEWLPSGYKSTPPHCKARSFEIFFGQHRPMCIFYLRQSSFYISMFCMFCLCTSRDIGGMHT